MFASSILVAKVQGIKQTINDLKAVIGALLSNRVVYIFAVSFSNIQFRESYQNSKFKRTFTNEK